MNLYSKGISECSTGNITIHSEVLSPSFFFSDTTSCKGIARVGYQVLGVNIKFAIITNSNITPAASCCPQHTHPALLPPLLLWREIGLTVVSLCWKLGRDLCAGGGEEANELLAIPCRPRRASVMALLGRIISLLLACSFSACTVLPNTTSWNAELWKIIPVWSCPA